MTGKEHRCIFCGQTPSLSGLPAGELVSRSLRTFAEPVRPMSFVRLLPGERRQDEAHHESTPATRMRPHSGKTEHAPGPPVHEPQHHTRGIRNATAAAVMTTATPAPSSIVARSLGMTMAPATTTASTAIATAIHCHSVPLRMMAQATPPQMPAPASIAAATHFIFRNSRRKKAMMRAPTIRWQDARTQSRLGFPR